MQTFRVFHFYQAKILNYGSRGNEEKKVHHQKVEIYSTGVHTCTGKLPEICKLRRLKNQVWKKTPLLKKKRD